MKKLKYIILLLATFVIGFYLYNASDIGVTASVKDNTASPKSSGSFASFDAEKDTSFTVCYSSNVKDGTLQLYIENSNGDIINKFPVNSKSSEKISFDTNDTYALRSKCTDFVGNFHVKVTKD